MNAPATRPKVLLLVREQVMHWAPLYVHAFRERCDVITCGPALDEAEHDSHGTSDAMRARVPNDLVTDECDVLRIVEALPAGWRPDGVVCIQSAGPAYQNIPLLACPTAYLSIDTWHDHQEFRYVRPYEHVFHAQRALGPYFKAVGIRQAHWLPLACSPAHHYPLQEEKQCDIAFAGTTFFEVNRQRLDRLNRLDEHFDVHAFTGVVGEDYCRAFARGRLAFNSSISQDVNMRVFEIMGMGIPLLTNRDAAVNGLDGLFEEGKHFIGYDDADLVEQAQQYLADPEAAACIAAAAYDKVLAEHQYVHRVDAVLETMQVGSESGADLLRSGDSLHTYLPAAPGRVLDVGLGVGRSRLALRRQGVQHVAGVAHSHEIAEKRARSYDTMAIWAEVREQPPQADTLVLSGLAELEIGVEQALAWVHRALPSGGELLLRITAEESREAGIGLEPTDWDVWAYERGYHLILWQPVVQRDGASVLIARLRRYERPLLDVSREIYKCFPGGFPEGHRVDGGGEAESSDTQN